MDDEDDPYKTGGLTNDEQKMIEAQQKHLEKKSGEDEGSEQSMSQDNDVSTSISTTLNGIDSMSRYLSSFFEEKDNEKDKENCIKLFKSYVEEGTAGLTKDRAQLA